MQQQVRTAAAADGIDPAQRLPSAARCLSPSDFGFHNALAVAGDELVFFDFEYAGWDDPAKLLCDFFCQVEVPVNRQHLPALLTSVAAAVPAAGDLQRRVELLLPVYGLKWCCIALNDFTPAEDARRRFSSSDDVESR